MIASLNRRSLWFGATGIALQIGAFIAPALVAGDVGRPGEPEIAAGVVFFVGWLLVIVGLGYYANAKGRSAVWAAVGILGIIGLLILAALKDYTKFEVEEDGRFRPEHEVRSRLERAPAPRGNRPARIAVYCGIISAIPVFGLFAGLIGVVSGFVGLACSQRRGGGAVAAIGILMCVLVNVAHGVLMANGEAIDRMLKDRASEDRERTARMTERRPAASVGERFSDSGAGR